jgi:hypothetical protein
MATFTRLIPVPEQADVPRTALVGFTILVDAYGVQMGTLSVSVGGSQAVSGGLFVNGYSGSIFAGAGRYVVGVYPKGPSYFPGGAQVDVAVSVKDAYGADDSYGWRFFTAGFVPPTPPPPEPSTGRACLAGKPFFVGNNAGLQAALDQGTGTEAKLEWNEASPYDENDYVVYNIYLAPKRIDVFEEAFPRFLVTAREAVIGGIPPGSKRYFGVRASEVVPAVSSLAGLRQAGTNMFAYPSTALDGYLAPEEDMVVPVSSVDGFPEFGVLEIDAELIRYLSVQQFPPAFLTDATGRGYMGTVDDAHASGSAVRLWRGGEDGNTIVAEATPTFQKPNYALTHVLSDGYGPDGYRDGYDGYDAGGDGYYFPRQVKRDDITTDGSNNDAQGAFPRFDYCGTYRRLSPAGFWQGQCVGSYFGGAQLRDGQLVRGNDILMQTLQREELLLETTGEPFVLMRRLWTGIRCSCFMLRREHPDERCPVCFGTGFVGGYDQFINPRRPDGRMLVRVDPASDNLLIGDKDGLTPDYKPSNWTMAFPAVKDRDVLVRFNAKSLGDPQLGMPGGNGYEEFRYEILDVTRVRGFFGQSGVQKFNMQRFHRTDIIYQVPVQRDLSPHGVVLATGVSPGPGIPPHSHSLTMPYGAQLSSVNGSTSVDERHSHIVRKGNVLVVLQHTHTLTG